MKIFLHIGDARTGTTTLQSLFTKNREKMRTLGIDYPEIGLLGNGRGIAQHCLPFSLKNEWPTFAEGARVSRDEVWGSLRRYMEESDLKDASILLSSEGFANLDEEGISFILDFFASHEVVPIFVRRDPEDWRRSMREQNIKRGRHVPELAGPARDKGTEKIARWSDVSNVKVIPYSRTCSRDVLAFLGVNESDLEPVERENVQFPKSVLNLLNSLNALAMTEENRPLFNRKILEWAAKKDV